MPRGIYHHKTLEERQRDMKARLDAEREKDAAVAAARGRTLEEPDGELFRQFVAEVELVLHQVTNLREMAERHGQGAAFGLLHSMFAVMVKDLRYQLRRDKSEEDHNAELQELGRALA